MKITIKTQKPNARIGEVASVITSFDDAVSDPYQMRVFSFWLGRILNHVAQGATFKIDLE